MGMTTTRALLTAAADAGTAVAAFNVITLEHIEAVLDGAQEVGRPVIFQISQNAVRFHRGQLLPIARAAAAAAGIASIDCTLHLDHVTDPDLLRQAEDAGFSSVMFDAGAKPYEDNVRATSAAVNWAHAAGLFVEAELGYIGGKADSPRNAHEDGVRTDPEEARRFVAATGVDALAVAVGSSHAMTSQTANLDHTLIQHLANILDVPLVLHGSSGVSAIEMRQAVTAGIRKVNIGTALNVAFTTAIRHHLAAHPDVVDPRKYLNDGRTHVAATVAEILHILAP